jgi:peptidoglycan hydrolase CwlO-like protein
VAKETATQNILRGFQMPEDNKKPEPTVSHDAVKTQLASLTLKNAEMETLLREVTTERDSLKKQVVELASVVENDLKADLTLRIMAKGDFKEADLEQKTVKELQEMDEILSAAVHTGEATYKNIRAGTASTIDARSTVGSLYGKTKAEIQAMGGEF